MQHTWPEEVFVTVSYLYPPSFPAQPVSLLHRYLLTITVLPLLTFNSEVHHVVVRGHKDAQDVFGQRAVRHDLVTIALSAFHTYSLQLSLSCQEERVASAGCSRPGPDTDT